MVIHSGTRSPADLSVELMMPLMIYDLKFAKGMQRASQKRTAPFIFWIVLTIAFIVLSKRRVWKRCFRYPRLYILISQLTQQCVHAPFRRA